MKVLILTEQEVREMIQLAASEAAGLLAEKIKREPDGVPGEAAPLQWLDKRQAARFLGCSAGTVDNLRRAGKLTARRVAGGKAVRFSRTDLLKLMGEKA